MLQILMPKYETFIIDYAPSLYNHKQDRVSIPGFISNRNAQQPQLKCVSSMDDWL